jgi:hypothetical protein
MKERPILFSAPMVRAILAGTKTQTRRAWKMPRGCDWYSEMGGEREGWFVDHGQPWWLHVSECRCPYGQPGDRLWVREAWRAVWSSDDEPPRSFDAAYRFWYEADAPLQDGYGKLRPSIHMPRCASRITLEVTGVRVERLQDISEADAIAEGVDRFPGCRQDDDAAAFNRIGPVDMDSFPIARCAVLWESINGPGSWDANPWVWVVEFKRQGTP